MPAWGDQACRKKGSGNQFLGNVGLSGEAAAAAAVAAAAEGGYAAKCSFFFPLSGKS